jgi:hypothetical protein
MFLAAAVTGCGDSAKSVGADRQGSVAPLQIEVVQQFTDQLGGAVEKLTEATQPVDQLLTPPPHGEDWTNRADVTIAGKICAGEAHGNDIAKSGTLSLTGEACPLTMTRSYQDGDEFSSDESYVLIDSALQASTGLLSYSKKYQSKSVLSPARGSQYGETIEGESATLGHFKVEYSGFVAGFGMQDLPVEDQSTVTGTITINGASTSLALRSEKEGPSTIRNLVGYVGGHRLTLQQTVLLFGGEIGPIE